MTLSFNNEFTNDCIFKPFPTTLILELDNYLYISSEMQQMAEFIQEYTGNTAQAVIFFLLISYFKALINLKIVSNCTRWNGSSKLY